MKRIINLLLTIALLFTCGCEKIKEKVTILYTNDVHSYAYNLDSNNNMLLNYASIKAMKDDLASADENVLLVDVGDFAQGTAYGAIDEAESIVELMNTCEYDVATIGNHEFDYGVQTLFKLINEANFPVISCNFYSNETDELLLEPYKIIEIGNVKIGFIGISTPETITKSSPLAFTDDDGNYLYDFRSGNNGQDLYDCVQETIDEIKDKVDYIIGLGHLGVDESSSPWRSEDVIANTIGLDAMLDGHSHTTMENKIVEDKQGNKVVLSQTGSYLNAIGKLEIDSNGDITTTLITEYDRYDDKVLSLTNSLVDKVNSVLGQNIAYLDTDLYINDPDTGARIVRNHETNAGDFAADSLYYYFNEIDSIGCDIAFVQGGGVRANIKTGEYSYLDSKDIFPFGNVACLVEISGKDILEALEFAYRKVGKINTDKNLPEENAGFLQVAGLKLEIDSSIESTVSVDENNLWLAGPTGEYKVSNVEVYNKQTNEYEPLDLNKKYKVAGVNFLVRDGGDGFTMFTNSTIIENYVSEDYLVLSDYAKSFNVEKDNLPTINSANSPLNIYTNYLIDYENPYGSNRIIFK